jgi:hypothetical protein
MHDQLIAEARQLAHVWEPHPVGRLLTKLAEALEAAETNDARYCWLREGNAYVPEESGVRGGEELDVLRDDGIAEQTKDYQ